LKHGRLAMLACVGFLVQEKFHPFFDGKITGPAIYHFQQANEMRPYFWVTTCLMPDACYPLRHYPCVH
jgi:light-harvesting complex I chlorophyll a/b binding protein 1